MIFDSLSLCRIAADLRRSAIGARVDRVFQPSREELVLDLRRKMPRPQIMLSWSAEFGRAHLAAGAQPRPGANMPIADVLRKHLRGATVVGCEQINFDRILHITFANCVGLGPQSRATLVAEIMGRHANLVLLDEDETIIACAKHVPARVNRYREVLPNIQYVPPPSFERVQPRDVTPEGLRRAAECLDAPVREVLHKTLMGASDLFLDETLYRAGEVEDGGTAKGGGDSSAVGLQDPGYATAVVAAMHGLIAEAEAEGAGHLYVPRKSSGRRPFAYPVALCTHEGVPCEPAPDLSAATEAAVLRLQLERDMTGRRERLRGFTRRALKKATGRENERRRALQEAEGAEALKRKGELIIANLWAIGPGASEVTVLDYFDPEQRQVTIALDENYSAQENAQAWFDRTKRYRRVQERVPALLQEARVEREYLEGILAQIDNADTPEDLDQLEVELDRRGHIGQQSKRRKKPPSLGQVEPRRYQSPEGFAVLCGKTGPQNDALLRLANGDDLWLHVKTGPGAHVLIRTGGRPDSVPESTLLYAAAIAAANSRQRSDSRVDVNYTQAKHVRKPPGAPPGFVTYTDFSTVTVTPAEA